MSPTPWIYSNSYLLWHTITCKWHDTCTWHWWILPLLTWWRCQSAAYMLLTNRNQPYFHSGAILIISIIIKHVISFSSKAEIGEIYYVWKSVTPLRTTLEELEHSQDGTTQFTTKNSTAHGLTLDTMVSEASKSNDSSFQWLKCRGTKKLFSFLWHVDPSTMPTIQANNMPPNTIHTCDHYM